MASYYSDQKEVLKFFEEQEVVTSRDLMDRFGYTYSSAKDRLLKLHKEGLIEQLFVRGTWGLTRKRVKEANVL